MEGLTAIENLEELKQSGSEALVLWFGGWLQQCVAVGSWASAQPNPLALWVLIPRVGD